MAESMIGKILSLSKSELSDLVRSMGIDDENRDDFLMVMEKGQWDNSANVREAVQYLGFDARAIKKAAENPVKEGDIPSLLCGNFALYEKNDKKTDLLFFLQVFLERGNNITKAALKCDANAGAILRRKAQAYGIIMDPVQNKNILGTKELTLARLAQAFSGCTAALIINQNIKGKLNSKLFRTLPSAILQHTVFPGLIPQSMIITDNLRQIALILNMEMSIILASPKDKRRMASKTIEELLESSSQYVDAAINGSTISDMVKCKILIKAGLVKKAGKVVDLSDEMKIMAARSNDIMQKSRMQYLAAVEALCSEDATKLAIRAEPSDDEEGDTPNE